MDATGFFVRSPMSRFGKRGHGDPVERRKAARRLERSRLLRIHEASEAAVEAGDVDAYDALNREFHEAIYRAAHNDFLAEQAIAVRTRLNAFRRMQLRQDRRLAKSRAEHDAVMRAIAEGDGDEAARRMRAHMLNAASALDSYIAHQDALHIQPAKT
ncbi:GntR family transcriptional regulator [Sphingomonas faeni]|uniref:GntR family transcriptional regulator n=1 Tax=Sphingomonas faeni TaxID=185950 RepID=UPI002413191B|nr:FCD domain-containing protein [Sphingomonas faeni]